MSLRRLPEMWQILIDKAEIEAHHKIKMLPNGQRVVAYGVMHRCFADVSGLGLAEQARRLMHPDIQIHPRERMSLRSIWQGKMRRLEAHGKVFKLAPAFKINALRMLMTGKATEYFALWEADRETSDAAKSYGELLSKVKDHSRRRKLDSSAKEGCNMETIP